MDWEEMGANQKSNELHTIKSFSASNKNGHGFKLVNGRLFCIVCGATVSSNSKQHMMTTMHWNEFERHKQLKEKNIHLSINVRTDVAVEKA